IVITNGAAAQTVLVRAVIMDHSTHTNTVKFAERLDLAPGEQRTLTASNDYGTANHFSTRVLSQNQDLRFVVTLTDGHGEEVARFNQEAFWVRGAGEKKAHKHDGGPMAAMPGTMIPSGGSRS